MKSTYLAALRDLIIAAASGMVVGSWMTGMTPFSGLRVMVYWLTCHRAVRVMFSAG